MLRIVVPFLALAFASGACARPSAGSGAAAPPAQQTGEEVAPAASPPESPGGTAVSPAAENPLLDDRAPDPSRALPRLSLRNLGLHVGGGTGTAEERRGLLDALAGQERRLLHCYTHVERPEGGGTFGVDLYIGARGGHPEIRALRHKLGGEPFESCMKDALSAVAFGAQPRPLVISYSVRFELSP